MKLRRFLFLTFVNLAVFAGLLLIPELGMRLLVETHSDHKAFRLTQPAPYRDAPYFSADFINESFEQPGEWKLLPGTNILFPSDYHGKYFNIENGIRRTTDTPAGADRQIYIFGGSTVYNSEVPDSYTIASQLQRKLSAHGYTSYAVVNLGVTSINTVQQVERLKITSISNKDIVIFYDGVNEVIQGVLYGNAGSTIVGGDRNRPLWQKIIYKIANHSAVMRNVLARTVSNYRISNLETRVRETARRYRENIDEAERYVSGHGARFLHFLQPQIFTLAKPGEYEERLLKFEIVPVQAEQAFRATYPYLKELVQERSAQGYDEFDLSSVFDNLEHPVYLDFCHVNHVAHEAIADAMLSALVQTNSVEKP